jgi:hypothetical protein
VDKRVLRPLSLQGTPVSSRGLNQFAMTLVRVASPLGRRLANAALTQFAITFCNGDLDPDTKRAA